MKPVSMFMVVAIALLSGTGAGQGRQTVSYGSPLQIRGSASIDGLYTKYTFDLRNVTEQVVREVYVKEAGVYIQSRRLDPNFYIKSISPGKSFKLNVWVRGNIAPLPEPEEIGMTACYYFGTQKIWTSVPSPQRCPPPGGN